MAQSYSGRVLSPQQQAIGNQ